MALYMVSGKGGVGKTHLSLSLAYYLKSQKRKVLLVEFAPTNQYNIFFERSVNFTGIQLEKDLLLASWSGIDCLKEYSSKVLGSERLVELFMSNKIMKDLIHVAPGLREIAVLGKATSTFRESGFSADYTDVVLDAPSSGHFTSLLDVPFGLSQAIKSGPMFEQCKSIIETLKNPDLVKNILVSLEKTLSFKELEESGQKVYERLEVKPYKVLNKSENTQKDFSQSFPFLDSEHWMESASNLAHFWDGVFS